MVRKEVKSVKIERKVCVFLAPMRNGTSVLYRALTSHSNIYGSPEVFPTVLRHENNLNREQSLDVYKTILDIMKVNPSGSNEVFLSRTHDINRDLVSKFLGRGFYFLISIRDPREVILSAKEWAGTRNKKNIPMDQYCNNFLRGWLDTYVIWKFLISQNENVYLAKHDIVCGSPGEYAAEMFDWLGVDSSTDNVDTFSSEYINASTKYKEDGYWKEIITDDVIEKAREIGFDI